MITSGPGCVFRSRKPPSVSCASGCRADRIPPLLPQSRLSGTNADAVIVNGTENILASFLYGKKHFFSWAPDNVHEKTLRFCKSGMHFFIIYTIEDGQGIWGLTRGAFSFILISSAPFPEIPVRVFSTTNHGYANGKIFADR
jgi:hypothetical protein